MKKDPWYQKTAVVIITSILGSMIGFTSISTLLGFKSTDKLNKEYYTNSSEPLFVPKNKKNHNESKNKFPIHQRSS